MPTTDAPDRTSPTRRALGTAGRASLAIALGWIMGAIGLVAFFSGLFTNSVGSVVTGAILMVGALVLNGMAFASVVHEVARPVARHKTTHRIACIVLLLIIAGAFTYGMAKASMFVWQLAAGGVALPIVLVAAIAVRWVIEARAQRAASVAVD
mgnify:CR=1 FL=1